METIQIRGEVMLTAALLKSSKTTPQNNLCRLNYSHEKKLCHCGNVALRALPGICARARRATVILRFRAKKENV